MSLMRLANIGAIIPAAGQGRRMGDQGNKLLLKLAGIPVLLFTLKTFNQCPYIKEIIIPAAERDIPAIKKIVCEYDISKVTAVVRGGKERQESVFQAIGALNPEINNVVIHDGARPLLALRELQDFLETALQFEAAVMAVTPKDTVKIANKDSWVVETLVRDDLRAIQTPQFFDRVLLEKVHKLAAGCGYHTTDDASLFEWQGYKVKVLPGSYENIKVTTPEDLLFAEVILSNRQNG